MKRCRRCGVEKSISLYYRYKHSPDGYQYWCKECQREWDQGNREANRLAVRRYKERNREKVMQYQRQYNLINRERKRLYTRQYREAHKEEIKRKKKEGRLWRRYYYRNHERINEKLRLKRRMFVSLDYKFDAGRENNDVEFDLQQYMYSPVENAKETVSDLMDALSDDEREACERFMLEGAAIPSNILLSIRSKLA